MLEYAAPQPNHRQVGLGLWFLAAYLLLTVATQACVALLGFSWLRLLQGISAATVAAELTGALLVTSGRPRRVQAWLLVGLLAAANAISALLHLGSSRWFFRMGGWPTDLFMGLFTARFAMWWCGWLVLAAYLRRYVPARPGRMARQTLIACLTGLIAASGLALVGFVLREYGPWAWPSGMARFMQALGVIGVLCGLVLGVLFGQWGG